MKPTEPTPKSATEKPAPRRRWRGLLIAACCCALLLGVLPEGVRWGAQSWLNQQPGLTATLEDVDLNLFSGTVQLERLQVVRDTETVLSVDRCVLQLDWWPLWHRQLQVRRLELEQGRVLIEQRDAIPLVIGGLVLAPAAQNSDPAAPPGPPSAPWGINTGRVMLQQCEVVLRTDQQDVTFGIDQLAGSPVISWQPQQVGEFDLTLAVADGTLKVWGQSQPFATPRRLNAQLQMAGIDVATVAPLLSRFGWSDGRGVLSCQLAVQWRDATPQSPSRVEVEGRLAADGMAGSQAELWLRQLGLDWQGRIALLLGAAAPQVEVAGELVLGPVDLDLQQSGLRLVGDRFGWQGTLAYDREQSQPDTLQLAGRLSAQQLTLTDLKRDAVLAALGQFELPSFSIGGDGRMTLEQLALRRLELLRRPSAPSSRVIGLAALDCPRIAVTPQRDVALETVNLAGLQVDLVRLPGGALEWQQWLPPSSPAAAEQAPTESPAQTKQAAQVQLAGLTIDDDSWLRFEDRVPARPVALALSPLRVTLGPLDNRQPQAMSPLTVVARFDQYAELDVHGEVAPFAAQPTFAVSGKLSEFQLPTVSPYVEQAVGYRLEQGQLNLDFSLPVEQGRMALASDLHLRRLRMMPLSAEDEAAVGERLGLPVNMALSLLRDRNGDIFLKLPVTGDLNDPNVAIGPVLRKALRGAVQNTVLLTLAPLGVVAKAGQLVGLGGALKFDPLPCEAGTVELTAAALAQLDRVRTLLQQRPQLTLSLCGRVSQADVVALQAAAAPAVSTPPNETATKEPTPAIPAEQLLALAAQRAEAVKAALVASGEVQPGQLLLCHPSAVVVDGMGGVELSL